MPPTTVPGLLLAAIKGRKFTSLARLFAPGVDFQAWTNAGHWTASDGATIAKIVEVWYSPGDKASQVVYSNEMTGAKGLATLEFEITWAQPDEQPRVLRQCYLLTIKNGKITGARVYCPGPHVEFPEVDLDKQRRTKGLMPAKVPAAKAS